MKPIFSTPTVGQYPKPTLEQISVAAYHLYIENGSRDGHDLDDWLRAERLLTQKLHEVTNAGISEPNRKPVHQAIEIRPLANREHPLARDERGSPSREEIRQKTTQLRPASRQPQWRTERASRTKRAA